jgi:hypothetical protein
MILTVLLPGMDSKAHRAEGTSRVTLAIVLRIFTAFGAWMADVFRLLLSESACCVVPSPLIFLPLPMDMVCHCTGPNPRRRWCRNHPNHILQHLHRQLPPKCKSCLRNFVSCPRPSLHTIHLGNRQKECELSVWPPFRLPHFLQPDRRMTTIIHVINPVLSMVVMTEWLRVLECFPFENPLSLTMDRPW